MLIVLSGKTASGKDTISERLLAEYPRFKKAITTTSRSPRDKEINNVDYHFLTKVEFEKKINLGEFAEYVKYGGNLYGTYKKELEQALGADLIWRIDPSRAGEVRDFIKRAFSPKMADQLIKSLLVIYITAPDEVILERLIRRGLTEGEIQKRITDDMRIWQQYHNSYDYVLENIPGQLNQTIDKINNILKNHLF